MRLSPAFFLPIATLSAASLILQPPNSPQPMPFRYNDQINGANGWPMTGNMFSGDTSYSTWASDGTVYLTWNDGEGPGTCNSNIGISTITSDLHTITNKNCMSAFGGIGQTGSDGLTWKSSGLLYIDDGRTATGLYWAVKRQLDVPPWHGSYASILHSTDGGVTFDAPPAIGTGEFPTIGGLHFIQYEQGSPGTANIECQNNYIYAYATLGDLTSSYLMRIARGSNLQIAANWQYYTGAAGGNACTPGNWGLLSSATRLLSDGGSDVDPIYIPGVGYLATTLTTAGGQFYQAQSVTGPWTLVYSDSAAGTLYSFVSPLLHTVHTVNGITTLRICFSGNYTSGGTSGNTEYSPHFRLLSISTPTWMVP